VRKKGGEVKKKKAKPLVIKGTVLPPEKFDARTKAKAMALHAEIVADVETTEGNFIRLAGKLAKMKTNNWWAAVTDEDHKGGFNDWDAYKTTVLGTMGQTKMYELLGVHELTQGDKPVAKSTIKQMGIKRAYQVSRLEPAKRTADVITLAQTGTLTEVKAKVQELINDDLPEDRKKEHTIAFVRILPPSIISRYEMLEHDGVWLEGIRDHDPTLTAKQKLFLALIVNFEATHKEQLKEAAELREATEGVPEAVHETKLLTQAATA
jgi:hypothetical protein